MLVHILDRHGGPPQTTIQKNWHAEPAQPAQLPNSAEWYQNHQSCIGHSRTAKKEACYTITNLNTGNHA